MPDPREIYRGAWLKVALLRAVSCDLGWQAMRVVLAGRRGDFVRDRPASSEQEPMVRTMRQLGLALSKGCFQRTVYMYSVLTSNGLCVLKLPEPRHA